MEDVLALYEKLYNAAEPIVCLDETPVSLHREIRPPIPIKPGSPAKRDNEYKGCGTANVFGVVEPKAGRHFTRTIFWSWTSLTHIARSPLSTVSARSRGVVCGID
jgi:hypothetical protein